MVERYFDNAATTPIDPRVVEAMQPWLSEGWGNAHSLHEPGRRAMAAVEQAREQVASLLDCYPEEIYFTSGATEANNWVLRGFRKVLVSPLEHSSVREPALALGHSFVPMHRDLPEPAFPTWQQDGAPDLVSLMLVNNEVGAIYPSPPSGPKLHRDITQALGKIPTDPTAMDLACFSAHKLYGPKGVGGLYARHGETPEPLLIGGEQEQGRRAGTLNVAAIVGFGAAAEIALDQRAEDMALVKELRQIVLEELSGVSDREVNGGPHISPYILSVSFLGIEGETLVIELDQAGFAISSGAACSSRSTESSHVLTALGLPPEWLRGTVRISFGRFNTKEAARELGMTLKTAVEKIRRIE